MDYRSTWTLLLSSPFQCMEGAIVLHGMHSANCSYSSGLDPNPEDGVKLDTIRVQIRVPVVHVYQEGTSVK